MSHAVWGHGNVTVLSGRNSLLCLPLSFHANFSPSLLSYLRISSPPLCVSIRRARARVSSLCAGQEHHQRRLSAWQRGGQLLQGTLSVQDWRYPGGMAKRHIHTHVHAHAHTRTCAQLSPEQQTSLWTSWGNVDGIDLHITMTTGSTMEINTGGMMD